MIITTNLKQSQTSNPLSVVASR